MFEFEEILSLFFVDSYDRIYLVKINKIIIEQRSSAQNTPSLHPCELNEALIESAAARSPVKYTATFDELNIDIEATYQGDLIKKPDNRPIDPATMDEKSFESLAIKLMYYHADKVDLSKKGDLCHVHLHFDH